MAATILSKQTSYKFLEEILKITNAEERHVESSKLDFLTTIVGKWYNNVPFQNIDQLCLTKREKRLPTVPEIIDFHLRGRGGVCLYNAIYMYYLLKALDYEVYITVGTIISKNDHAICVANNVQEQGDSYLVEVGSGWPCFAPIPLHRLTADLLTAEVYQDSFFVYALVKEGDLVVRYHRKDYMEAPNSIRADGWWKVSTTDLRPVEIEYLYSKEATIWKTCVDVPCNRLMRTWLLVLYRENKCTVITGKKLMWDENKEKQSKHLEDKPGVVENIKRLFPMIDEVSVSEAIDFIEEVVSLYGKK